MLVFSTALILTVRQFIEETEILQENFRNSNNRNVVKIKNNVADSNNCFPPHGFY